MKTKIIETSDRDKFNWGKFLIGRFDDEWQRRGQVDDSGQPLLSRQGWGPSMSMDLSVGYAAVFLPRPSGAPDIDAANTGIYFCPTPPGWQPP